MHDLNGTEWKHLLDKLLAETDAVKLRSLAYDLETTLFHRCQILACGDVEDAEREALKVATARLLLIRVQKLGFPLDPSIVLDIESGLLIGG